ncbi:hypothetical protein BG015_003072 [Linnemannia schmuckeri]|uniref:Uncharacterized protein n=1 Tax=Linnemannia schmuckeri TaxID=64567 RepID=A0A9P5VDC9_9FUNG|nr:hypothetical protein BG015_003072 [Linnemannia schmuckeri]
MPTIMSQNVVRPEDYKADTTAVSDTPLPLMDSHHLRDHSSGNGRIVKDLTIVSDSPQVAAMAAVTAPSKALHITSSSGSRHHTKTRPLAIQTTSLHTIGKSSDNNSNNVNNSSSHPNTASSESTSSSTTATSSSSTTPPSSIASSTSSTTSSPMSHIRRWTSSLSSSKSNSKSTAKVRTIGPISAPQPLTTPVPYACTPLPYFDLPTPDHFPVSALATQQYSPRSSPHSDCLVPRSPAKPATSCPDLPVGPQACEYYSNVLAPIGTYASLNRSQRTSWKDRLFNSNPKKQDRRASTNSNVEDDYEWSSNQEVDASSSNSASATTTSSSTTPTAVATSTTEKQPVRPRMRISPPLTQPVLPANQKTVPIMQSPLMSPTDDLFGPDTFDPFKIAPKSKAAASGPVSMMMMMAAHADEVVLPSASPSSTSSVLSPYEQRSRPTVDTQIKPSATPAHQLLTPPSSHSSEDSFPFASPTSSSSTDEDKEESTSTPSEVNGIKTLDKPEAAVLDFAASLCEGLVSDFVMPPSYFDQHNLSFAFEDAYPRADPDMMPKVVTASSPPPSPPSPRSPVSSRSSQSKVSLKDRSLKSTSTYSTDSDSSFSSVESEEESSDDESSLSPVSGASFFSTMPPTTGHTFRLHRSTALKPGGIKIPSSLMTLLPTSSSNKSKATPVSPSTTPPVSPPLAHAEIASSQMANLAFGAASQTPPGMIMALADPRAMMLKRLAYIHTLRKLRERERRPFRHAVLLHLILLQLRRGITNRHCSEIAEFYVAMSAAQFPPRLDIATTMTMAQQQRSKLQQQQQLLSQQPPLAQIPGIASPVESIQESVTPVRSSSKTTSTSTSTSGDKEPKSKRSLVFSLQSRNQTNKSSSNNGGESGWSLNSTTNPAAATPAPSQISVFKERLPLLRIPTYPLINLEKNSHNNNNNNTTMTPSATRKNLAAVIDAASEDDQGIEESNVDFQPGLVQPAPTVILPKRTTGRKGLLYQQQLQLRMRQQMSMTGGNGGTDQATAGASEQDQTWLQSHLVGSRPRFATSTFTTVRSGRSDVVTRPLVPLETVKVPSSASESSSAWSSFPFGSFGHRGQASATTTTSAMASTTSSGATTSTSQDGNESLSAGLLTPPLSPPFRNPFSTATSNPTTIPATLVTSTGSVNTTNNSNLNTSIPPSLLPSTTPTTSNNNNGSNLSHNNGKRSSYTAQGHHSPPSTSTATFPSHHTRVVSAGSVSSYTLPHIQSSHHTIGFLEGQAVHARSRSGVDGNSSGRGSPPPLPPSSASSLSRKQQLQLGLPSPPLSPTLDAEGHAAAMLLTVSASMNPNIQSVKKANLPQRSLSSGGYHVQQLGMIIGSGSNGGAAASGVAGGRSENIPWIMRAPSPVNQHDLQTRHSMDDMRNRRLWKSSSSSATTVTSSPAVVSASATAAPPTAATVGGGPANKKSMKRSSAKGGVFSPEECEEEDVPLAFVQRRISSDTLRSMA